MKKTSERKETDFSLWLREVRLIVLYNFVYLTFSEIGFCLSPLVALMFSVLCEDEMGKPKESTLETPKSYKNGGYLN